jgi:hypothetical protein
MRTTSYRPADADEAVVAHDLDEGETWEKYGMKQPNPHFSHRESWYRQCPVCSRILPGVLMG